MAVIAPIIHLNGDRKETIIAQYEEAWRALRAAYIALQQCAPNARNYYVEDGLFPKAQKQHWERVARIKTVMDSIRVEVSKIQTIYPTRGQ